MQALGDCALLGYRFNQQTDSPVVPELLALTV